MLARAHAAPHGEAPPDAWLEALVRHHRRALTTALVVGGAAHARYDAALAFHRESSLRRGPFIARDAARHADALAAGLTARATGSAALRVRDPLALSEGGTLFIDRVERLAPVAQRLLAALLEGVTVPPATGPRWAGRLVCGAAHDLEPEAEAGRFHRGLLDSIDKVRVELDARREVIP